MLKQRGNALPPFLGFSILQLGGDVEEDLVQARGKVELRGFEVLDNGLDGALLRLR
jgi:hypothetical protein